MQANPLLDNFEGLALGPYLPGGRRALLLQSDDNFDTGQVTRVIAPGPADGRGQPPIGPTSAGSGTTEERSNK